MSSIVRGASGRTSPASRKSRPAVESRGVRRDALALEGSLEKAAQEVERLADGDVAAAGFEAVGLPARDRLGPDVAQAVRAEVRRDVVVVEAGVVLARLGRERDAVRGHPDLRD